MSHKSCAGKWLTSGIQYTMKKTHWAPREITNGMVAACRIFRETSARSGDFGPSDPTSGRAACGLV